MGGWSMTAPMPAKPLNMNDADGSAMKRRDIHVRKAAWKESAWAHANVGRKPTITGRALVRLELGTTRPNQRRDPSNWYPTMKAIIDGLTDAKFWPDDNSRYVATLEPEFTQNIPHDHYRVSITWEDPDAT